MSTSAPVNEYKADLPAEVVELNTYFEEFLNVFLEKITKENELNKESVERIRYVRHSLFCMKPLLAEPVLYCRSGSCMWCFFTLPLMSCVVSLRSVNASILLYANICSGASLSHLAACNASLTSSHIVLCFYIPLSRCLTTTALAARLSAVSRL